MGWLFAALLLHACLMKVPHLGSARVALISMLLGLYLPQTISEGLAGALQRAADLKASWGDDFVSAEHLLQVRSHPPARSASCHPCLAVVTTILARRCAESGRNAPLQDRSMGGFV